MRPTPTARPAARGPMLPAFAALAATLAALALAPASPAADRTRGYELVSFPAAGVDVAVGRAPDSVIHLGVPQPVTPAGRVLLGSLYPVAGQPSGPIQNIWSAERTATGWQTTYAGVPVARNALDGFESLLATSPDFQSSLWGGSSHALDPDDPSEVVTPGDPIQVATTVMRRRPDGTVREQLKGPDPQGDAFTMPQAGFVSDDGETATFDLNSGQLLTGAPLHSIYQRTGDGPIHLVSRGADGALLDSAAVLDASGDGSRVLYTGVTAANQSVLALWRGDDHATVLATDAIPPIAVAADHGLSYVLFLTRAPLVAADTDSSADLYRYDVATGATTLLTKGAVSGGDTSDPATCVAPLPNSRYFPALDCDADLLAIGDDGRQVYFVSPEVLDGATGAVAGEVNVYRVDGAGGAPAFVTRLAYATNAQPDAILFSSFTVDATGSLTFESSRTFDPHADTGGFVQVQRYDRATGAIRCLTCPPDGSPATADARSQPLQASLSSTPGRNVTADGRYVYVTTTAAFSPKDTNTTEDVYEIDTADGTRTLISGGSEQTASRFAGLANDGQDVFFQTRQTLVPQDLNGAAAKIYDARIGGGFPVATARPECRGDGCRATTGGAPAAAPIATDDGTAHAAAPRASRPVAGKPTQAALRALARTGRLAVRLSGVQRGDRLRVKLVVGGRAIGQATGTATRSTATLTLRLPASARASLLRQLRRHKVAARLSVEAVTSGATAQTTISIPQTKTGAAK